MANVERLTKRVKEMEKWIAENEGGPTLNNMNYLITSLHNTTEYAQNMEQQFNAQRNLLAEFLGQEDLTEKWNEFLQQKQEAKNAVQEQQTEEVSVQEEAEGGEEAIEAQEEEE